MNNQMFYQLTNKKQENINPMIGTPDQFQGSERDIMIFTLAMDKG